jgi:glycosyltransferase involved in cell wall biosynthesis
MVSVITPVYNAAPYLREAIDSVLAQTYTDWELILIDDGSTDSSGEICTEAARHDRRIRSYHTPNHGVSAARNLALSLAKGDFITFLDADDILHPRFLEYMVEVSPGMDMVWCRMANFSDTSTLMQSARFSAPSGYKKFLKTPVVTDGTVATQDMLYQSDPDCSPCAKLFARHLWNDRYFRTGIRYEDLDIIPIITLSALRVGGMVTQLYFYRQHPESFIHTFTLQRADVLDVTARLSAYMAANAPRLVMGARSRQLSANFNIFGLIAAHRDELPEAERVRADEIAAGCWEMIKGLRRQSLLNPSVRVKNKIGIILSYIGGRPLLSLFSRRLYR